MTSQEILKAINIGPCTERTQTATQELSIDQGLQKGNSSIVSECVPLQLCKDDSPGGGWIMTNGRQQTHSTQLGKCDSKGGNIMIIGRRPRRKKKRTARRRTNQAEGMMTNGRRPSRRTTQDTMKAAKVMTEAVSASRYCIIFASSMRMSDASCSSMMIDPTRR